MNERTEQNKLLLIGIFFLVAGSVSLSVLQRRLGMGENLADGITGLFFGLAFGVFILHVIRRRRRAAP